MSSRKPSPFHELGEEALRKHGSLTVTLGGHSMTPTLLLGDRLHVHPSPTGYHAGDVVVFRTTGGTQYICHRLILPLHHRGASAFIQKGDAPGARFGLVETDRILGRVTSVQRGDEQFPLRPGASVPPRGHLAARALQLRLHLADRIRQCAPGAVGPLKRLERVAREAFSRLRRGSHE